MLNRIGLPVCKVVHGINAPLAAGAVMLGVQDAVHHRIAHVQVRRRHVDLCTEHTRSVRKLAFAHPLKKVKVLLRSAIAMRTVFAGLGKGAAILANFFGA